MATWTIGAAHITRVEEQLGFASFPPEQYFAGFEREMLERHVAWLPPHHYSPEHHRLITSVHAWLIRTERHTILLYAPHWNSRFCEIPEEARITRRRMLEHCAEHRALLFPTHFGVPHVAAIAREANGFSLRFVSPQCL